MPPPELRQLRYFVAIVEDGETVLRDMQGGGQERIATDTVVHAVLRGLRTL